MGQTEVTGSQTVERVQRVYETSHLLFQVSAAVSNKKKKTLPPPPHPNHTPPRHHFGLAKHIWSQWLFGLFKGKTSRGPAKANIGGWNIVKVTEPCPFHHSRQMHFITAHSSPWDHFFTPPQVWTDLPCPEPARCPWTSSCARWGISLLPLRGISGNFKEGFYQNVAEKKHANETWPCGVWNSRSPDTQKGPADRKIHPYLRQSSPCEGGKRDVEAHRWTSYITSVPLRVYL